jgi:hypothetical protein
VLENKINYILRPHLKNYYFEMVEPIKVSNLKF